MAAERSKPRQEISPTPVLSSQEQDLPDLPDNLSTNTGKPSEESQETRTEVIVNFSYTVSEGAGQEPSRLVRGQPEIRKTQIPMPRTDENVT